LKRFLFVSGWAHGSDCAESFCNTLSKTTGLACDRLCPAGLISHCPQPVPRSAYCREVLSFLDGHKDATWIGIGWSLGAVCLLEASLEQPSAFEALVGCGATASFCSRPGYTAGIAMERVHSMLASLKKKPSLILQRFFRDARFPGRITDALLHSLMETAERATQDVLEHGLSYLMETDLRLSCERISVPVLLCHGKQDRIVPPEAARFCAEHIPDCLLRDFPDNGHYLFDSPLCIDSIGAFLSGRGLL